ncbi:hypothetical protein LGM89_16205 [Burkholderia sp. AU31624]|uniref:hypothetical protein n=1 Tax=Burkholderia sp. AU31624 TaxID=2879629 RepID=UPI001CF58173|nr:hypothetical protein [Burkholderia sp. AU31624]MCA8254817.1 hypothetical protein [Burkholderia sp. AU31624]
MAAEMVARGYWTKEQAGAALAQDGIKPTDAAPTAPEGVDPLNAAIFEAPTNPDAYNFGTVPANAQTDQAQDMAARQLFVNEGVPASIGNEIGRLWNAAATNPPTEGQRAIAAQQAETTLRRQWGEQFDSNIALAQREVQRMAKANPNIHNMLEVSGLGNNPWLISTIVHLAQARGRT